MIAPRRAQAGGDGARRALAGGPTEAVAETARWVLRATSLTLSVREGEGRVRSLVNVGDLGPGEERWPNDESYSLAAFPESVRMLAGDPGRHVTHVEDADGEPGEIELLRRLEKACCLKMPILVHGRVWGEMWATRTADQPRFTDDDVELARVVASMIASGLDAAR